MCINEAVMGAMLFQLLTIISFHTHCGVIGWKKEQQIEISVGADESETRICRPITFCWSKVLQLVPCCMIVIFVIGHY